MTNTENGRRPGTGPAANLLLLAVAVALAGLGWYAYASNTTPTPAPASAASAHPSGPAWWKSTSVARGKSSLAAGALRASMLSGDGNAALAACRSLVDAAGAMMAVHDPDPVALTAAWHRLTWADAVIASDCDGILAPSPYISSNMALHMSTYLSADQALTKAVGAAGIH